MSKHAYLASLIICLLLLPAGCTKPVIVSSSSPNSPTYYSTTATIAQSAFVSTSGSSSEVGYLEYFYMSYVIFPTKPSLSENAFMQFTMPTLPSGASIVNATLHFWTINLTVSMECLTGIYKVTSSWDKATISTANETIPPSTNPAASAIDAPGENSFDITTLVRGWENGTSPNYGVQISPCGSGAYPFSNLTQIYDHDDPNYYPRIIIVYTI